MTMILVLLCVETRARSWVFLTNSGESHPTGGLGWLVMKQCCVVGSPRRLGDLLGD